MGLDEYKDVECSGITTLISTTLYGVWAATLNPFIKGKLGQMHLPIRHLGWLLLVSAPDLMCCISMALT